MTESQITIHDIAESLDKIGLQYMATIGLDGKPKVRPVQYMVVRDGKLWFCTNSQKAMYAEMQSSPFVELCGSRLEENEIATIKSDRVEFCDIHKQQIVKEVQVSNLDMDAAEKG